MTLVILLKLSSASKVYDTKIWTESCIQKLRQKYYTPDLKENKY